MMLLSLPFSLNANTDTAEPENKDTIQEISNVEFSEQVKELKKFLSGEDNIFSYEREKRPDPFKPFISETVSAQPISTSTADTVTERLTGMRRFEPGQLALVGIVHSSKGPLAMVEDSVGKGYIIYPGTLIGRRGVVETIAPNIVVISESYLSTTNEKRYRQIEMVLKKEGEQ